jgi:hypothetical protein
MARTVAAFGIYPSIAALHAGAEALKGEGFRQTDISVLYSDRGATLPDAHHGKGTVFEATPAVDAAAFLSRLAGVGALTLPGIGPLLAGGPLASAFSSAAASGDDDSVTRMLVALGLLEDEAERYEGCLKNGDILLSVSCDDAEWEQRARTIMTRTGAAHLAAAAKEAAYQP